MQDSKPKIPEAPEKFFFPLTRLLIGANESNLHIDGQLYAMVLEDRFIFVVVHYERDIATPQYN
jgi:hypothetical protein